MQKEPTGPLGLIASAVVVAYTRLAGEVLAPFGIGLIQWAILENCARTQSATVTSLAQVLPVDSATISRNVEQLVQLGLLQRQRLERDRRIVSLTLPDHGRVTFLEIAQRMQVVDNTLLAGVTEEEFKGFLGTVRKVTASAARYQEPADPGDSG